MTDLCFPPAESGDWPTVSPREAGWSVEGLEEVARYCEDRATEQLVILHGGRILLERYWGRGAPTATIDVASVQKSVTSLLLGVLQSDGRIQMEDPVARWLGSGWTHGGDIDEDAILLHHLSSMTSGLYDDFTVEAQPGDVWYYNNNAYHQLRRVVEVVTNGTTQQAFDRLVAQRLGMAGAQWIERPAMIDPHGWVLSGLFASARHLARVGLCVLGAGQWSGSQLVDSTVLGEALTPSQDLNPSYGHLWWLPTQPRAILPGGEVTDPRKAFGGRLLDHPVIPSAPADLVAGFGAGDKRVYVSSSMAVVVVRLGSAAPAPAAGLTERPFDEGLWQLLKAAAG